VGVKVKVARRTGSSYTFIGELSARSFTAGAAQTHFNALVSAATTLANAPANTPLVNAPAGTQSLQQRQAAVVAAQQAFADADLTNACEALTSCFAAGTKLWTPHGYRCVEEIQANEVVYARNEFDPDGTIAVKVVEEKFERTGRILHLHLPEGRLICTTPEHPFYVEGAGWTAAGALQVGDRIRTDCGWATVQDLLDTGEYETVYNLRVAEYHTYFVGDEDWPFAVWAHNDYSGVARVVAADPAVQRPSGVTAEGFPDYLKGISAFERLGQPAGVRGMTEDQYRQALERVLRRHNLLAANRSLAPETVAQAFELAKQHGNRGRSPFMLLNPNDPNPYTPGTNAHDYYNRIQALITNGHPEAIALRDLLPYGTRGGRYAGIRMQLWRTEYYAQQGLLRGVEVRVSGPNGNGEVDILVAASPSDAEGTRLIDTKYWTQSTYYGSRLSQMRDQLRNEVRRYLTADRVTASGQVIPNGYTLTLEFPGSIPLQFRDVVAELQATYAGRLFVTENLGTPP
jgi:hypothetical protein